MIAHSSNWVPDWSKKMGPPGMKDRELHSRNDMIEGQKNYSHTKLQEKIKGKPKAVVQVQSKLKRVTVITP